MALQGGVDPVVVLVAVVSRLDCRDRSIVFLAGVEAPLASRPFPRAQVQPERSG